MMKTNKTIKYNSKDYNNNKNTTRTWTNFKLIKKKLKVVYLHVIHWWVLL